VETLGTGNPAARESLDSGIRPPMWTITTFE